LAPTFSFFLEHVHEFQEADREEQRVAPGLFIAETRFPRPLMMNERRTRRSTVWYGRTQPSSTTPSRQYFLCPLVDSDPGMFTRFSHEFRKPVEETIFPTEWRSPVDNSCTVLYEKLQHPSGDTYGFIIHPSVRKKERARERYRVRLARSLVPLEGTRIARADEMVKKKTCTLDAKWE
jgi:hypothetical protein